jgi:hypothetical protein
MGAGRHAPPGLAALRHQEPVELVLGERDLLQDAFQERDHVCFPGKQWLIPNRYAGGYIKVGVKLNLRPVEPDY